MDLCNDIHEDNEYSIYASIPQINNLCCASCEIDFINTQDSSAKSNFHWQTMQCRLLIFLVPDIIATPVLGTERFLFIITSKEYFNSGKLQKVMKSLKLVYGGLRPVTTEIYKLCLSYTIQCKVAPLWNKIGQYFVQGKEFYNSIQGSNALRLDIFIDDKNVRLQLRADKIKVPYVKLEDFYLPETIIADFLSNPKGHINLTRRNISYVHVLPSMKKGKVLSVSKEIPISCPFKDYQQLRRHWKNMYGYSLPKNEKVILYYEIKFRVPGSNVFTYPNVCITTGPIDIIRNEDKPPAIKQFLIDMMKKVPQICGKQLQLSKDNTFNMKTPVMNLPSLPELLNSEESFTRCSKQSNIDTVRKLEFSNKYGNRLLADVNNMSGFPSLKARLSKIHQIHNTMITPYKNRDTHNINVQDEQQDLLTASTSGTKYCTIGTPDLNATARKDGNISPYFKIQKTHFTTKSTEEKSIEIEGQKNLSLKEKLQIARAKGTETQNATLQKLPENIDVVAMAKNNKLGEVKCTILSDWLKKHSIPHNKNGRKGDMINKILSHIRNTQTLNKFRV